MDDEDFMIDEDFDSELSARDLQRLQSVHCKAGYRDGLNDGQESTLQRGFDSGFSDAALRYKQSSKLRGVLSAMLLLSDSNDSKLIQDLKMYLDHLKILEKMDAEIEYYANERSYERDLTAKEHAYKVDSEVASDVETMFNSFSLSCHDNAVQVDKCHEASIQNYNNESKSVINADATMQVECSNACPSSGKSTGEEKAKEGRSKLKYEFDIEKEFEKFEVVLKRHQVSDSFITNLRMSLLK